MNSYLDVADPPPNVCRELGYQASDYAFFSKDETSEMVDMCGNYLDLGCDAHIFCFSVQPLICVRANAFSTENDTFLESDGKEQVREVALFSKENLALIHVRGLYKFNRNSSSKCSILLE